MIRTPCSRANLIGRAEEIASGLVALTERERAAYRAAYLSDPYSRPTFERAHRRAAAARDEAFETLIEACDELCREGLGAFAINLQRSAVKRCEVAIDIAAFELADSFHQSERKDSFHAAQGMLRHQEGPGPAGAAAPAPGAEMPGLPRGDHAGPTVGSCDVRPGPAPQGEGRFACD